MGGSRVSEERMNEHMSVPGVSESTVRRERGRNKLEMVSLADRKGSVLSSQCSVTALLLAVLCDDSASRVAVTL